MSAATSTLLPEYYTWGFPGAPIQIHINLDTVSALRKNFEAAQKDTGTLGGCGLLIGDTPKVGITQVVDYRPLPVLDSAAVEAAKASSSRQVVGFYRTTPVCGVSMRDEDKLLAASSFRHPASVFLLVEAGKSGIGDARFCFWGEGELFDWPLMLFPFDAEELAVEEARRRSNKTLPATHAGLTPVASPAPISETPPAVTAAPVSAPMSPPAGGRESKAAAANPPRGRMWLIATLATMVMVLLLAGGFMFVMYVRRINAPPATPAEATRSEVKVPLGLGVERRGNDLRISWNGNAPLIAKADFGMLMIRGTAVNRDVSLSAEELRSGSVMYTASGDQVRFQLNVVAGEQVAREFLTVLMPAATDGRPAPLITRSENPIAAVSSLPPVSSAPASARELRQFKPAENRTPAAAASHIDEPPAVPSSPVVNPATPSLLTQPPVLSQPLLNRPPASTPAPADIPAQPPAQVAVSPSPSGASPPVATRQILPSLPPLLRGQLWKPTMVEVNVSVDAAGNVVKAEAIAKPNLHPLLREAAVDAARRWKFKPAQFDGHPVPANMILQFNFAASR
jgi:protein TonB